QDYDAVATGLLLFGTKIAAQRRLNPEQREKTGRDAHAVKLFRIAWSGQCVEPEARRGEAFKGCVVLAPMEKIQRRYGYSRPALARVGCPNLDQPVPIRERQGSEQHAVYHAEHRGVGADPHGQGQGCYRAEPRTPHQSPDAIAKISQQSAHANVSISGTRIEKSSDTFGPRP